MNNTALKLENIHKSYGSHSVLKGVNMTVEKGNIYGLVGKNGAGKTSLFKLILGLSNFSEGKITIADCGTDLNKGRRKIGFLIGGNFYGHLNARDNLKYLCRIKHISNPKKEIERVLKIVGLDKAKGPYSRYSMGMKQRLGIANAILGNPEILILDEPVNGLDPQGIADIRHLIHRLRDEFGMTIIVSSHILGELQNTADVFGIVHEGKIVQEISKADMNNSANVVKISVNNLNKAQSLLEKGGVEILSSKQEDMSLEDFYFNLVGGQE